MLVLVKKRGDDRWFKKAETGILMTTFAFVYEVWLCLPCAKGEDEKGDQERSDAIAGPQHGWGSAADHDNMSNTANDDAKKDGLEPAELHVGDPGAEDGEEVGQESEEKGESRSKLKTLAPGIER